MAKLTRLILLVLIASSFTVDAAFRYVETNARDLLNIRVTDYAKFKKAHSSVELFAKWLEKDAEDLFDGMNVDEIHNIYFKDYPKVDGEVARFRLGAFVELGGEKMAMLDTELHDIDNMKSFNRFQFVELLVTTQLYEKNDRVRGDVYSQITKSIPLDLTNIKVQVSLADRKMIVSDRNNDIKMIFPLGVGSFDEGVLNEGISILTPRFKAGFLDKKYAIYARKRPRYFMKKPFIRIHASDDTKEGRTSIGFHTQPNGDEFIRAFDSHGCMRMQDPDLYSLYWIVVAGPRRKTPIVVNFYLDDSSEHPFPKREKPYKRVKNYKTAENPYWALDLDGLVQTESVYKSSAPVSELFDQDNDDWGVVFDYKMAWRISERRENKRNACKEKYTFDESKYVFDESKYKFDDSKYIVKKSDYQVKRSDYFKAFMSYDERKDAQKDYEKAQKKADKAYRKAARKAERAMKRAERDLEKKRDRAKRDLEREKEKAQKEMKEKYDECIDNITRDYSLGERIYRWWVHGK